MNVLYLDALPLHLPEPFAALGASWYKLADLADFNVPFQLACVTSRRDWIAAYRDEVVAFVAGYVEALLRINRDCDFALEVQRKWGPSVSDAAHRQNWEFASREFAERPFPTEAAVATIRNAMTGTVPGAEDADPARFIERSVMEKLEASGVLAELQATVGVKRRTPGEPTICNGSQLEEIGGIGAAVPTRWRFDGDRDHETLPGRLGMTRFGVHWVVRWVSEG